MSGNSSGQSAGALTCALATSVLLFAAGVVRAAEIHVYPGGSIQSAINGASDGDEIIVHAGTYYENLNTQGKAITLRSTDPEDPEIVEATILDGGGTDSVIAFSNYEESDTVISGFTITHGYDGSGGGGMRASSGAPTVTYCWFVNNSASKGGGMYSAPPEESGLVTVMHCRFVENAASQGGGMYTAPGTIVVDCVFIGNDGGSVGGGLRNASSDHPDVTLVLDCTFIGNDAGSGAGMYNSYGDLIVANCLFFENEASEGGGVYIASGDSSVINSTFSGNTAIDDYSGAIGVSGGNATATNCIMWDDYPGEIAAYSSTIEVTYCCIEGGYEGESNFDADPLFVDPENGDCRLAPGSPCIDAGDTTALPRDDFDLDGDGNTMETIPFDLDGNPRRTNDPDTEGTGNGDSPVVDIGCYEFQVQECPADIDGDGDVDTSDLLALLAAWGACP
jgi:hypothetical protein